MSGRTIYSAVSQGCYLYLGGLYMTNTQKGVSRGVHNIASIVSPDIESPEDYIQSYNAVVSILKLRQCLVL